jgi:hypothetical protein
MQLASAICVFSIEGLPIRCVGLIAARSFPQVRVTTAGASEIDYRLQCAACLEICGRASGPNAGGAGPGPPLPLGPDCSEIDVPSWVALISPRLHGQPRRAERGERDGPTAKSTTGSRQLLANAAIAASRVWPQRKGRRFP